MVNLEFKIGDELITTDSFATKLGCNALEKLLSTVELRKKYKTI